MATFTRETVGLLNEKLTVKISKEEYYPSFEKAIKDYSKKANIPGFRKGMVPAGMVKKMYGASIFYDEVIKAVEKGIQEFLSSEKPDIFAQPLPLAGDLREIDMNNPADYEFPFELGLKPDIELPDLKSSAVTLNKVNITEEMINLEIDRLQNRHRKITDVETITSGENILNVKFVEADSEENLLEEGIQKNSSVEVKDFSTAVQQLLMGKMKNDNIQLQLSTAFEENEKNRLLGELGVDMEEAGAMDKQFKMTITNIGLTEKRELEESFFEEVFPGREITTEDAFRKIILEDMQAAWNAQSRVQLHDQLYHIFLDTPMEFPEDFLKKWMQRGGGGDKEKSPEEIETEFPTFKDQLKWTLIRDKILRENNIKVSQDEVRDYMQAEVLQYFGHVKSDGDMGWTDSYIDRMLEDKKQVERIYNKLITDKLFSWAETKAKPVEKEVTAEELTAMMHNHQH